MGWAGAAPAWADPPVSALPRLPVCGDQDTSPVQLKCADFVPIPDIEVFRVPGQGPIDLTFDFVFSEASVPNELDVFQVDDLNGRIGTVSPAEAGYLPAALARARTLFPSGSDASVADTTIRVTGGDLLVFFIVHGGTLAELPTANPGNDPARLPVAFFSLTRLNPDPGTLYGGDHVIAFRSVSSELTEFAFEDTQPVQRLGLRRRRLHRLGAPRAARLRRPGQRRRRHRRRLRHLSVGGESRSARQRRGPRR